MFKGKLWLHQLVLFGVLGVLILWSVLNQTFVFNIALLWWLLGAMIGFLFIFLDRFVYNVFSKPNETLNLKLKELKKDELLGGIKMLLSEDFDQKELVMRSFLFLVVWMVLAFFAMTSVVNPFARGFMLGMGTHLVFDLIYDYIYDKLRLDEWFWQIKRTLEPEEKLWFVVIVSVVYIIVAFNM